MRTKSVLVRKDQVSMEESDDNLTELKVPVIYYLSRNGQLEHPHLMYVSISSPHGTLSLQDVKNRLSFLRGQGIADVYSWSTKRSYRNGFVWQDLSENDLIYPSNSHEYVLKGTQLIDERSTNSGSYETILSMPSSKSSNETHNSCIDAADSPSYKAKIDREFAEKVTNASTQTEEKGGRQRVEMERGEARKYDKNGGSLSFSSSSFRSLEGCLESSDIRSQKTENEHPSGRMRATQVLMQLIRSCSTSTTVSH